MKDYNNNNNENHTTITYTDIISGLILCTIFGFLYFIYWIFFIPMNWIRDLTDVSYGYATKTTKQNDMKKEIINRIRRLRKIGNNNNLIPPPYPNGWFALIESDQIKSGQAVHVASLGEHFVIFRTENNDVHVLDAYCPHMGANLGIGGIVHGDCIQCPFHKWSFRGSDGQCVNIPYSDCNNIPKMAKVKKWISIEINDFIFVWYHAENENPWKLSITKEIKMNYLVYLGRNEFMVNCHIQEIAENGADTAHFSAVHGDSIFAGNVSKDHDWMSSFGTHTWNANWKASTDPDTQHIALVELKHCLKFINKLNFCTIDVEGKQIGPSYVELRMQTFHGPVIVLQTVTPIEPMTQKVIHRFYAPRYAAIFVKLLALGESIMFERDINVWNHKMFINSPCLVKEDRAIKLYRNWYSQFYSANSKTFSQAKDNFDW